MPVETLSFGCRLNAAESETMRARAEAAGHGDGLVIVNSCAVTAEAGRQVRQAIRRTARRRPDGRIVVTGCGAEVERAAYEAMPEVSVLLPNRDKTSTAPWAALAALPSPAGSTATPIHARTRAILPVQNGCDHRCTFCIIPFGRGEARSTPLPAVVDAVRALVEAGTREVVLTGVDLTSYGTDQPGRPTLGGLVKGILREVPGLDRLRLSSIDSIEADEDLLDALGCEPRLMPHLHLSLQSGDDLVLKRMARRHSRADAIAFCREARRRRPDLVFGADFIAGFPTESDEAFAATLDLVEACGLTQLHVFPFSPRPGTPAARMPPVARPVVLERAARLRAWGAAALHGHLAAQVGRRRRVLVERGGGGRTEDFTFVRFPEAPPPGDILEVVIAGHDGEALIAAGPSGSGTSVD